MPTSTNSTSQGTSSGDPHVRWPKPPMMQVVTVAVAAIAVCTIIMTIVLFKINSNLEILTGAAKAGIASPSAISPSR